MQHKTGASHAAFLAVRPKLLGLADVMLPDGAGDAGGVDGRAELLCSSEQPHMGRRGARSGIAHVPNFNFMSRRISNADTDGQNSRTQAHDLDMLMRMQTWRGERAWT